MRSYLFSLGRFFSVLALVVSFSFIQKVSADEKEEYLAGVTGRLTEAMEEVFYRFSDHVMRKYCPSQYETMMDYVSSVYHEDRRITLTELANRKEEAMAELLDECENKATVIGLEYQYNEFISLHSADVIARVRHLLDFEDEGMTLASKIALADQVVEAVLANDFNEKKILEQIEAGGYGADSAVKAKYLASSAATLSIDFEALMEMAQASEAAAKREEVKKTQKKGRCAMCNKKLGLMPFECPCHLGFCAEHRYPEMHHCTFDHKAAGKEILKKAMHVVIGDKIKDRL